MIETVGIGAVAVALVGLLTWVLKNKAEQDLWAREQAEKGALALEKNSQAQTLLASNVSENTRVTKAMLELITKLVKTNKQP